MSFARLKATLQANYKVDIVSTNDVIQRVNRKAAERVEKLKKNGKTPPPIKQAAVVDSIRGRKSWSIRAIDLLRKIGALTTPRWVNMAQLSASWATRRYFWAIGRPESDSALRLSNDARQMDFHQKTLLSDEFGIGMGGLVLERFFSSPCFVDISVALNDPAVYQGIHQIGRPQPDYLMWGRSDVSPYYVVECKGCQTSFSTTIDQLRRGLEQIPAVVFASGPKKVVTLVVATCIDKSGTTVFIVDPPTDGEDDEPQTEGEAGQISEQTGKRSWRIVDSQRFQERSSLANESVLLKWAGQFHASANRDAEINAVPGVEPDPVSDLTLEERRTPFGNFKGASWPLFPELGRKELRLFTGVQEDLLFAILERRPNATEIAESVGLALQRSLPEGHGSQPDLSVGQDGTCMIVEGWE